MANKTLKAITAEAKRIRASKPSMKWTEAIKKASAFYRDKVVPTAKKTAKKAKAVYKATAKGYQVAKRSYAKSKISGRSYDIDRAYVEDLKMFMENEESIIRSYERSFLPNIATKIGRGTLDKTKLPKLMEYLYKNHKKVIDKYYSDYPLNPAERKYLADLWADQALEDLSGNYTELWSGRTNSYQPLSYFTKGNLIGKISIRRAGTSRAEGVRGKIGMKAKAGIKKVARGTGKKPLKPNITELKKHNPLYFEKGLDQAFGVIMRKIFFSPAFNQYIMIEKSKMDNWIRYKVLLIGTPGNSFKLQIGGAGRSYNTIAEVNKKYGTDIID